MTIFSGAEAPYSVLTRGVVENAQDRERLARESGSVVRLQGVSRRFGETQALRDISLTVQKGEILGLIGRSGAGKSTLIRCLNGLEQPDEGVIEIEGRKITGLSEKQLQSVRSRVGMVFQHFNLLSAKTVAQNVALPLKIAGLDKVQRAQRVAELLELVGLADKAHHYPAALSGGQKQRVGIARALAASPALLLCDEATSALDPETTRSILALLKSLNQKLGITILLITHEMEVIKSVAHRVAVIDAGEIIEQGPVWQVFAHPQSALTRTLLRGLLPQLPEALAARMTQQRQGEAIYSVHFAGEDVQGDLLTRFAAALPGKFRLLQGGVDHIQHYAVVRFFIALSVANVADEQQILSWLRGQQAQVELVGYVASDD
ncbi:MULTISPECIES: methionine ABC transporter ATP-binding protein [unclassified Pantoea]|uniref:methionine ABC transporter ATP-binding protein n=1 Tax=unclassified Pantoea TaxID=2630326 RepID=UPI001CD5176A|nr:MULTISPECIES: ATP-binding cassette domain-containing protein [unclassified Pantoea]MCA1176279.1 ATP-binding cassette domain-containing protein [Pantoea sp. alder69]MCA1249249.1 ATP-binding cassette domain-containing protein [Pantoea sp. alder70]MCA1264676.1 ATP-binding cassette domain-containing protein [Pantoea sp. alder81]